MIWGLLFSCLFCNQPEQPTDDDWWVETGGWDDTAWDEDCSPWISLRDADLESIDSVDFGIASGPGEVEVLVYIQNRGDCALDVEDVAVQQDGEAFDTDWGGPESVSPGEYMPLTLIFSPELPGEYEATVSFESSDPYEPMVELELTGALAAGQLETDTVLVEMGAMEVGCPVEVAINFSAVDDVVSIMELSSGPDITVDAELPVIIEVDTSWELLATVTPSTDGTWLDELLVLSTDIDSPELSIPFEGIATGEPSEMSIVIEDETTRIFPLVETPATGSVLVTDMEGGEVADWTYDADANAVVFPSDAIPELGVELLVSYFLAPTCE